jgi:NAD(P)-dependent dehydrogenase (short-subunit alcohol dehydrogenase family)
MTFFKSKVVLITGSGGGLGRHLAGAYLEAGAHVVLCDIHEERLKAAEEELSGKEPVFAQKVDVADEESVKGLFKAAVNKFGRIDVVVNNAAIFDALGEYLFCSHSK